MALAALILSLIIAALGALGVVSPARFLTVVRFFETPAGLYLAAGLRLALGVALVGAASTSRAPTLVRALGALLILVALVTPFLGRRRGGAPRPLARVGAGVRGWAGIALALGLALAYAVSA